MCNHVLCALYMGLLNPWYAIIIPMYNAHTYFYLKNGHIIHGKTWQFAWNQTVKSLVDIMWIWVSSY